jgi:hypothetical protein
MQINSVAPWHVLPANRSASLIVKDLVRSFCDPSATFVRAGVANDAVANTIPGLHEAVSFDDRQTFGAIVQAMNSGSTVGCQNIFHSCEKSCRLMLSPIGLDIPLGS